MRTQVLLFFFLAAFIVVQTESIEQSNDAESFQDNESFDTNEIKEDSPMDMSEDDKEDFASEDKDENEQDETEEEKENDSSDDVENSADVKESNDNQKRSYDQNIARRNRLVTTKHVLQRGWRVTLKVRPFGTVYGWSNILHATIGDNAAKYGDRTPGIWFHSGSTRLHICSAVNGNTNYCYNDHYELGRYKFTTITIEQVQDPSYGNHYFFRIIINGKRVLNVLNYVTQVFHNVKYFVSDPWYHAAKVNVINFKVETFRHQALTGVVTGGVVRGREIKQVNVLPRGWKVQFVLKPLGFVYGYASILHATNGGNHGLYGDRIPGIWFNSGSSSLHICSAVSGHVNYCYNSHALPIHKSSTIIVQQVQRRRMYGNNNYGLRYHFEIYINGVRKISVVNSKPAIFHNVRYYASDPWYNPARAIVSHFKLETYGHRY